MPQRPTAQDFDQELHQCGVAGLRGRAQGGGREIRGAHRYPGTQHGFNNYTTPRYEAAAAKLAWERTVTFLKTHLRAA
jgi:dienelactone hydrolase